MPKIELSPTEIAFGTLFIGGIGWIIGRYWDARRHFREKRDEFKRFLGQWLQSVERIQAGDAPTTYNVYVACERDLYGILKCSEATSGKSTSLSGFVLPCAKSCPTAFI
jgi:hypothetical protein